MTATVAGKVFPIKSADCLRATRSPRAHEGGMSMTWKQAYRAALIEVDPVKLLGLIHDTEIAIALRADSLLQLSRQELQEMNDATCGLKILKTHAQRREF